jgi:hypothetical protein
MTEEAHSASFEEKKQQLDDLETELKRITTKIQNEPLPSATFKSYIPHLVLAVLIVLFYIYLSSIKV